MNNGSLDIKVAVIKKYIYVDIKVAIILNDENTLDIPAKWRDMMVKSIAILYVITKGG